MKRYDSLAAAVLVLAVSGYCGSHLGAARPNEEPIPGVPGVSEPDPISSPWSSGFKCYHGNQCPPSTLRNGDGSYDGCTSVLGMGCTGSCYACAGSTNAFDYCIKGSTADECLFVGGTGSGGQPVNCGAKTEYDDCYSSANKPLTEPFATPNGCYCRGNPTLVPGVSCMLNPCNNPSQ